VRAELIALHARISAGTARSSGAARLDHKKMCRWPAECCLVGCQLAIQHEALEAARHDGRAACHGRGAGADCCRFQRWRGVRRGHGVACGSPGRSESDRKCMMNGLSVPPVSILVGELCGFCSRTHRQSSEDRGCLGGSKAATVGWKPIHASHDAFTGRKATQSKAGHENPLPS
jgi:hypothetical protein